MRNKEKEFVKAELVGKFLGENIRYKDKPNEFKPDLNFSLLNRLNDMVQKELEREFNFRHPE
jgi:hypothetical protein